MGETITSFIQSLARVLADPIANVGLPIAIVLALALLIVPPILHLFTGWSRRREAIVGQLSRRGIALYFVQFRSASKQRPNESDERRFKREYGVAYGRRHYVYPLIQLTAVGLFLLWLIMRYGVDTITHTGTNELPVLAVAAIAGAYFWVVLDLIRRCHGRDLAPLDLNRASLRLAVAIPLGYAFTATLGDSAVWLAFLLGALPIDTLTLYARKLVDARLNMTTDDTKVSDLTDLDGVTKDTADRLRDVGISTINQLALVDPIDLSIRTDLPMSYVTDCISQALAFNYLTKAGAQKAQKYFLRGAIEIYTLVAELNSIDPDRKDPACATLKALARDLDLDDQVLKRQLEAEISSDTHTQFLVDLQQANAMSDATASRFFADKPLVLADGVSEAKLMVWLRTREGREVRGEPVIVTSDHDVVIQPDPIARTDTGGKAVFSVTSREPGRAVFTVKDTLEDVELAAKPAVVFGDVPMPVEPAAATPTAPPAEVDSQAVGAPN